MFVCLRVSRGEEKVGLSEGGILHISRQNEVSLVISIDLKYSARCLIGSRIIESAAYCNKILLIPLHLKNSQNTSVN